MNERILVVNAGSATVKFACYAIDEAGPGARLTRGLVELVEGGIALRVVDASGAVLTAQRYAELHPEPGRLVDLALSWLRANLDSGSIVAVGHRVVHGGETFAAPTLLGAQERAALAALIPLAPLHQPHNLAAIDAAANAFPRARQLACFDTAFHRTQPRLAQLFALPRSLTEAGVKRYGFHGLSYEYIAQTLPAHLGALAEGKVIVAHLGSGASMCAMQARASVATSMGFTALDGLMMGSRPGALDPGVLLYLLQGQGWSIERVTRMLYHESGLRGVSGISADMRSLLASDLPHAHEAVELFIYRAAREFGALAAVLGGVDALVFTGGIGEHSPEIRARLCARLNWLGVALDQTANSQSREKISAESSRLGVYALATDEEAVIARHTARAIAQPSAAG